jgi:hypothetical protein
MRHALIEDVFAASPAHSDAREMYIDSAGLK